MREWAAVTRAELAEAVREMRRAGAEILTAHAYANCQQVPMAAVQAIADALGDISISEAVAAVDRLQAEALARLQAEAADRAR